MDLSTSKTNRKPLNPDMNSDHPLHITIRFQTSLPDLPITISDSSTTTVIALKVLIRNRINSRHSLRLIYQGRILPDTAPLSAVLRKPQSLPPPPSSSPSSSSKTAPPQQTIYVNCSIGENEELTPEDLRTEADRAKHLQTDDSPTARWRTAHSHPTSSRLAPSPRPRGFDRFLESGLTPDEVADLRIQFHARYSNPADDIDAPPSSEVLLQREDAWLDTHHTRDAGDADVWGMDGVISSLAMGFFFPLGSAVWLLRHPGFLLSPRISAYVVIGVCSSVVVGGLLQFTGRAL